MRGCSRTKNKHNKVLKMSIMWDLQEEDRTRGQTELRKGKRKTKMRKSEAEEEDAERDRGWPDGVKEPFAVIQHREGGS